MIQALTTKRTRLAVQLQKFAFCVFAVHTNAFAKVYSVRWFLKVCDFTASMDAFEEICGTVKRFHSGWLRSNFDNVVCKQTLSKADTSLRRTAVVDTQ